MGATGIRVRLERPGCANGVYAIQARGALLAALRWADAAGPLPDWTPLAYVPVDADGRGSLHFFGGRAVPSEATHVAAELIGPDLERRETLLAPLPEGAAAPPLAGTTFGVLSDLHMSAKPGRTARALGLLADTACVLLPGDLTNDGLPEQFLRLHDCIEARLPGVPALAVTGNHDYPVRPLPLVRTGPDDYPAFQDWLLRRAAALGVAVAADESGAWRARLGDVEVFGLNAAAHWRRFVFPGGAQLDWLEAALADAAAARRIVLCHAPLLAHNPQRRAGEAAYLSRDARLQEILDARGGVVFLSGHTHISPQSMDACATFDAARGNVYYNDGSVVATDLHTLEPLASRDWKDGCVTRLTVAADGVELAAVGVSSGKRLARGYYRFAALSA